MKVKIYGTRGSVPIANPSVAKYGGNTTCLRIISECLPDNLILCIDAGSGFIPLSQDVLKEKAFNEIMIIFTHYHHDHTQGLFLSPLLYMKNINKQIIGPSEHGIGPKKMLSTLMRPPFFPVHFKEVSSVIKSRNIDFPQTSVFLFHNKGGVRHLEKDEYYRSLNRGDFFSFDRGKFPIEECLVIAMLKSHHPEYTISLRFEEKSTGKVFVFLTDHENEDRESPGMKEHISEADLLIIDCQYTREQYDLRTSGFGHSTPDYCARLASTYNIKAMGLTHHDPSSTDEKVEEILKTARELATNSALRIFACADYDLLEL